VRHWTIGIAAAALALAGCGDSGNQTGGNESGPIAQIPAPNGDWTQTVEETPEGGYRMGNPDAPVKLVEYASISCHVCAEFSEAGSSALANQYVRSGQVSWEYRPFMLAFPTDPGLFALLRCQGPVPFFHLAEQLYASQEEWAARVQQSVTPEQMAQLDAMSPTARAAFFVRAAGLEPFFRQRGMPEGRINSCLADQSGLERLAEMTSRASQQDGISGTPTFFINGQRQDVTQWEALEPRLRAAMGS
jgi:protein-disulfide isomerase